MADDLDALIERLRGYKMTPEELVEQRVSFSYGQQDHDKPGLTKEQIREMLIESQGRPACPKCTALKAKNERLAEALTPSAETKAAYMGEFSIKFPEFDADGNEYMRSINVPWTTIKEIMAAIHNRAANREG